MEQKLKTEKQNNYQMTLKKVVFNFHYLSKVRIGNSSKINSVFSLNK